MRMKQAAGVLILAGAVLCVGWYVRTGGAGSTADPSAHLVDVQEAPRNGAAETRRLVRARPSAEASKAASTAHGEAPPEGNREPSGGTEDLRGRGQVAGRAFWKGEPLRDACIQVFPANGGALRVATSGTDGAYVVEGVPEGLVRVDAGYEDRDGDFRRATVRAQISAGAPTQIDFHFDGDAILEGKVTLDGAPAEAGVVTAMVAGPSASAQRVGARLDAYGRYYLEAVPSGEVRLMVAASREGQDEKRRVVAVTLPAGATMTQDIDIRGGSAVTGRLTGLLHGESAMMVAIPGADALAQGITLERMVDLQDEAAAMTRAGYKDGEYRLAGLEPGTYTLAAIAGAGASADDLARCRIATCDLNVKDGEDNVIDFDMAPSAGPPADE